MPSQQLHTMQRFVWNCIGHVPLRTKIIGIVITATCLTGSGVVLWMNRRLHLAITQPESNTTLIELNELLVAVAIAMTIGLIVAWLLTNILTRQVAEVTRVAQQVQHGNLLTRAPIWADDEIGALAQSFNDMIDSMTQSRARLVTANEELTALNELALMTTRVLGSSAVLSDALEKVLEISLCNAGIVLLTKDAGALALSVEQRLSPALHDQAALHAADDPLLQQVLHRGHPLRMLTADDTAAPPSPLLEAAAIDGFQLAYLLPLQAHGAVGGIVVLLRCSLAAEPVDDTTMPFLVAICGQLSMVVENAALWEELKRKEAIRARLLATAVNAQEQERERISRELHDETGQALTALLVQLKVLERLRGEEAISAHAAVLRTLVLATLEEVRRLARDLRPGMLDELGLVPTLEWHLRNFGRNTNLIVNFETDLLQEFRLPVHTELALYRVVQEGLTNIARHASATRALVRLETRGSGIRLTVEDNGCGFTVHTAMNAEERGVGLLGIQERVELIGGTLTLESSDQGTCLSVDVPIPEKLEKVALA